MHVSKLLLYFGTSTLVRRAHMKFQGPIQENEIRKFNVGQSHVNLSPLALLCSRVPLVQGGVQCLSYGRVVLVWKKISYCNMLSWQGGGPCNVITIETLLNH